jgi:hypothetical protein
LLCFIWRVLQANQEFERFHSGMRWEQKWCCLTGNYTHRAAGHHHIFYVMPVPLTQQPSLPWTIPTYALPDACRSNHDMPLGAKDEPVLKSVWSLPQHPCNYFQPGNAPRLPRVWHRSVSLLQLPVSDVHGWNRFKVPGDKAAWLDAAIKQDGRGTMPRQRNRMQ